LYLCGGWYLLKDASNLNMYFSVPSLIFWAIFVVPMVAGIGWILWQDKKRRKSGIAMLVIMVVITIIYMYVKTKGL
jgi:hypothetical protein